MLVSRVESLLWVRLIGKRVKGVVAMGFMDKMKKVSGDVTEKAQEKMSMVVEDKKAEREEQQLAKQEQKELARVFSSTNDMGDMSVDTRNMLFKVRHASAVIPKQSGALMKTGKALAAVYTLGASVAIEHAMKPDDKIFRFEELRSFELLEDDSQIVGGGVGMALAGGALFGTGGAIAGSMVSGKKTKKTVDNLLLKINLRAIDFPCVIIPYITKTVKVTSNEYKKALGAAQQTISCIELIIEMMDEQRQQIKSEVNAAPTPAAADPVEQVKKLKELMDMGVLSQEEFEVKKRELLGL